jgi:hypothetical protein
MPAKPMYQGSAREIVRRLQAHTEDVLDRSSIERFLGVKKRRALEVMASLGTRTIGNAVVVPKENVILYLEGVAANDAASEAVRRQRFGVKLKKMEEERIANPPLHVEIPTATVQEWCRRNLNGMPEGFALERQRLTIDFADGEDLLRKLAQFVTIVACNRDGFMLATDPDAASLIPIGGSVGSIARGAA